MKLSPWEKEIQRSQKERERQERDFQASLIEPLWYLRSIPYQQYRMSHHWKKRSAEFRVAVDECELQCDLCGIRKIRHDNGTWLEWIPQFHVHHVSYENLGAEPDSDLRLVCSACHNAIHFPDSAAAKFWIDYKGLDLEDLMRLQPLETQYSDENPPS